MMNPWPVVRAEIRRAPGSFVAIVALIAVAVALGVGISAQERAFRAGSARAANAFDILIGPPGDPTDLMMRTVFLSPGTSDLTAGSLLAELQDHELVRYVSPLAFGDRWGDAPIVGVSPEFVTRAREDPLTEGREFGKVYEAVVGADVDVEVGDVITPLHGMIAGAEDEDHDHAVNFSYTVVGRMSRWNSPWDRAVAVPVEAIWLLHGLSSGHADGHEEDDPGETAYGHDDGGPELNLDEIPVGAPWDGRIIPEVPAVVVSPLTLNGAYGLRSEFNNRENLQAFFPAEVLVQLYRLLGGAGDVLSAIAVATQVLVVIAVLLAVFATLAQRRRTLAVLRALGAGRSYVFATVWVQTMLMILLGAVFGWGLGYLFAGVISGVLSSQTSVLFSITMSWREAGMAAALVIAGMLLALIPALKAYSHTVSQDLRS